MAITDERTPRLDLQLPFKTNALKDDVERIRQSLTALDTKVATVDGTGKIPIEQLPSIPLAETYPVESEAEMLALDAQPGSMAIRADVSKTFVLMALPASELSNWKEMLNDVLVQLAAPTGTQKSGHRRRTAYDRFDDEVSVLDFGPANQFGTAMMAAMDYVMSQGGGTIFVPGRSYTLDQTITKTLTKDIHIRMSRGADVVVNTAQDVYNLNTGDYLFSVEGGKTTVSLGAADTTYAVFRINGRTLQQTSYITGHTLRRTGNNNIGYFVFGIGVNASEFMHNHISAAAAPYHFESSTENSSSGLVANAMELEITGNKIYNASSDAIQIVNKGYYGCEGIRIKNNIVVCSGAVVSVVADSSLRGSYMPPVLQIIGNHGNAYKLLHAEKVSRIKIAHNDFQSKFRSTDTVNGMVELFSCQGFEIDHVDFTAVAQDGSAKANINTVFYLGELDAALPNAYLSVDENLFWLDGMTAKIFNLDGANAITGRIMYGRNTKISLSALIAAATKYNLSISADNYLDTYDVAEGLAYMSSDSRYTFDTTSGILTILSRGPARDLHVISTNVVPNGSTINQIVANNIFGRRLEIEFAAAELVFTHSANMTLPEGKTIKEWLPPRISVEFFASSSSRIWTRAGLGTRRVVSNPAPGAAGSVGDEYYDATTGKWKKYFPGAGYRVISTTDNT